MMRERKMPGLVDYIMNCQPEKGLQIRCLILRNPEFRTMCEDYGRCYEAKEYWKRSQGLNAVSKTADYEKLCRVLEVEILQTLKDNYESRTELKYLRNVVKPKCNKFVTIK